jgi:hypothetical protein
MVMSQNRYKITFRFRAQDEHGKTYKIVELTSNEHTGSNAGPEISRQNKKYQTTLGDRVTRNDDGTFTLTSSRKSVVVKRI